MMNDEKTGAVLTARCLIYELLQRIFGAAPEGRILELYETDCTRQAFSLVSEELKNPDLPDGKREEILELLQEEYTRLMEGPGKLPAPPWESVYRNEQQLLFQESTLQVREEYRKYQMLPAGYPREADDHLALELGFMGILSQHMLTAFREKRTADMKRVLADQRWFLDDHLLQWVSAFADGIQKSETRYFYPQMAELTARFLRKDRFLIGRL